MRRGLPRGAWIKRVALVEESMPLTGFQVATYAGAPAVTRTAL